jgi:putative oxidoreductase
MNASQTKRERRIDSRTTALTDAGAVLGFTAIAPLFLQSAIAKLTGLTTFLGYIGSVGLPFPAALGLAILVELLGGRWGIDRS